MYGDLNTFVYGSSHTNEDDGQRARGQADHDRRRQEQGPATRTRPHRVRPREDRATAFFLLVLHLASLPRLVAAATRRRDMTQRLVLLWPMRQNVAQLKMAF